MTIRSLPINDATKVQYQLWIIDPSRDEKPVDGGVFDIASVGESIVAIQYFRHDGTLSEEGKAIFQVLGVRLSIRLDL